MLTRNHESDIEKNEQIYIVHGMQELLEYIENFRQEFIVIGGASLYKNMLEYAKTLVLTEIDAESKADVYFPRIDESKWNKETIYEGNENGIVYKRELYVRK